MIGFEIFCHRVRVTLPGLFSEAIYFRQTPMSKQASQSVTNMSKMAPESPKKKYFKVLNLTSAAISGRSHSRRRSSTVKRCFPTLLVDSAHCCCFPPGVKSADRNELATISSQPTRDFVYHVGDFKLLNTLLPLVGPRVCSRAGGVFASDGLSAHRGHLAS